MQFERGEQPIEWYDFGEAINRLESKRLLSVRAVLDDAFGQLVSWTMISFLPTNIPCESTKAKLLKTEAMSIIPYLYTIPQEQISHAKPLVLTQELWNDSHFYWYLIMAILILLFPLHMLVWSGTIVLPHLKYFLVQWFSGNNMIWRILFLVWVLQFYLFVLIIALVANWVLLLQQWNFSDNAVTSLYFGFRFRKRLY